MKTIQRSELQNEYTKLVECENSFDSIYKAHGSMVECNFGGLLITLNKSGDACIIVRDWNCDTITISDVLEIEFRNNAENEDSDYENEDMLAGFEMDGEFYQLSDFMRI